jgi:hypothetical protein
VEKLGKLITIAYFITGVLVVILICLITPMIFKNAITIYFVNMLTGVTFGYVHMEIYKKFRKKEFIKN